MLNALRTLANAVLRNSPDGDAVGFKVIGDNLWIASFTNNALDSHKQILSAKSHESYVARVKAGFVPLPELWHWHQQATKHGEADYVDIIKSDTGVVSVVAVGHFDDTPAGHAAALAYKSGAPFKLSHGFVYPRWALKGGVYSEYNTFEISTLPPNKAANQFTTFEEVATMGKITAEVAKSITDLFADAAPDILAAMEKVAEQGDAIAATGVKYKDFAGADADVVAEKQALPESFAAFAGVILEGMQKQGETIITLGNALETLLSERKEVKELGVRLDTELKLAPQRVQDAVAAYKAANPIPDAEADDANAALDQQEKGGDEQFDPMFPGMEVPLKK